MSDQVIILLIPSLIVEIILLLNLSLKETFYNTNRQASARSSTHKNSLFGEPLPK